MKELTNRQWTTYFYILFRSEKGERATLEDIVNHYPKSLHEDGYELSANDKAHDKCRPVWGDVTAINKSLLIDKIVIIDKFTYRIGSKEETEAYCQNLKDKAIRALARLSVMNKKLKRDGQGIFENLEDDTLRYIDTFLKEE